MARDSTLNSHSAWGLTMLLPLYLGAAMQQPHAWETGYDPEPFLDVRRGARPDWMARLAETG
jgi:hypothetical protein